MDTLVKDSNHTTIIKDWNVPASGVKMYRKEGEILCVADFNEGVNYVVNKQVPIIAVHKKRGDIPRFKRERIFSTVTELMNFFELVKGQVLCGV